MSALAQLTHADIADLSLDEAKLKSAKEKVKGKENGRRWGLIVLKAKELNKTLPKDWVEEYDPEKGTFWRRSDVDSTAYRQGYRSMIPRAMRKLSKQAESTRYLNAIDAANRQSAETEKINLVQEGERWFKSRLLPLNEEYNLAHFISDAWYKDPKKEEMERRLEALKREMNKSDKSGIYNTFTYHKLQAHIKTRYPDFVLFDERPMNEDQRIREENAREEDRRQKEIEEARQRLLQVEKNRLARENEEIKERKLYKAFCLENDLDLVPNWSNVNVKYLKDYLKALRETNRVVYDNFKAVLCDAYVTQLSNMIEVRQNQCDRVRASKTDITKINCTHPGDHEAARDCTLIREYRQKVLESKIESDGTSEPNAPAAADAINKMKTRTEEKREESRRERILNSIQKVSHTVETVTQKWLAACCRPLEKDEEPILNVERVVVLIKEYVREEGFDSPLEKNINKQTVGWALNGDCGFPDGTKPDKIRKGRAYLWNFTLVNALDAKKQAEEEEAATKSYAEKEGKRLEAVNEAYETRIRKEKVKKRAELEKSKQLYQVPSAAAPPDESSQEDSESNSSYSDD